MKRLYMLVVLSCMLLTSWAQDVYICRDGYYTKQNLREGLAIDLQDAPDSITFSKPIMHPVVEVAYNGTEANVMIPSYMKDSVICTRVNGLDSYVLLEYTGNSDEIIYNVTGSSDNGALIIKSDYKMRVNLNGVTLNSQCGEAMRFKCGKRIALVMADGSVNTFADSDGEDTPIPAAEGKEKDSHKACIYTKGHLEISGNGTLNVTGNFNHAIDTKEYLKVKRTVKAINILGAKGDGIHAGEFFEMNGGMLTIDDTAMKDGIQVEYKRDDAGAKMVDDENTGDITINGGTINITQSKTQDVKCIKTEHSIAINGGTLVLKANANGTRGIQADRDIIISQAEGATTDITIYAQGAKCTVAEHKDDPDKCMGVNVGHNAEITGGTMKIYAYGQSSNGLKADNNLIIKGGETTIDANGVSVNGMKIGNNVTVTGGTTKVANEGTGSKGVVYSGTWSVTGGTFQASRTKK